MIATCSPGYACAKSLQSCLTLGNPMDCSSPGSSVHGIFQARILEWVAFPAPGDLPWPGDQTQVSCIAGGFFTIWATREAQGSMHMWIIYIVLFDWITDVGQAVSLVSRCHTAYHKMLMAHRDGIGELLGQLFGIVSEEYSWQPYLIYNTLSFHGGLPR